MDFPKPSVFTMQQRMACLALVALAPACSKGGATVAGTGGGGASTAQVGMSGSTDTSMHATTSASTQMSSSGTGGSAGGPPSAIFSSDFSLGGTGTTATALTDGGRWDDTIGPHNNIAVVTAASAGIAAGCPTTNVYRVTNSISDLGYNWIEKGGLWPGPASGEKRFYRLYLWNDTSDAEGNRSPTASYHPLEFAQDPNNAGSDQFNLIAGSNDNGTFDFRWAPLAAAFPKSRWVPYAAGALTTLPKFQWLRIEWSLTREGTAGSWTMDAQIHDASGTLLYSGTTIRDASAGGTLAATGTGITGIDDASVNFLRIGTNGGSIWQTPAMSADEYFYWTAIRVQSDTWCGPYVPGET